MGTPHATISIQNQTMENNQKKVKDFEKRLDGLSKDFDEFKELNNLGEEIRKRSLNYPFKRIFNILSSIRIGTIFLIFSILTFTFAFAFIANFVSDKVEKDREVKQQNQLFIEQEQEKRRNNPAYGILSAILSPYNKNKGEDALTNEARAIKAYIQDLFKKNKPGLRLPNIESILVDMNSLFIKSEFQYVKDEQDLLKRSYNGNIPLLFDHRFFHSLDEDTSTTILIPPSEYSCPIDSIKSRFERAKKSSNFSATLKEINKENTCILPHTWESFKGALLISKLELKKIDTLLNSLEQVYYVSFDGIFSHRVENDSLEQLKRVAEEQPMYRWEASSYAQHFIDHQTKNEPFYESKAYLDIAGLGIVKTISIPVFNQNNKTIGVICFDKQISIKEYLEHMTSDIEKIEEFDAKENKLKNIDWKYGAYKYELFKLPYFKGKTEKMDGYLEKRKKELSQDIYENLKLYIKRIEVSKEYDSVNKVSSSKDDDDSQGIFRIILQRGEEYHYVLYISSFQTSPQVEYVYPVLIPLALIMLSFYLLFRAARRTIAQNEKAGLANILRNLPVGVLELEKGSNGDVIKFANDYAEEITGMVFDRFGESPTKEATYYNEIIDLNTIITRTKEVGQQDSDEDQIRFKKVSYQEIQDIRNNEGKSTSYYAKLNKRGIDGKSNNTEWVEITGSPILDVDEDANSNQTFGVFRKVLNKGLNERLNEELDHFKKLDQSK